MSTLEAIAWCGTAIAIAIVACIARLAFMGGDTLEAEQGRYPEDDEGLDFLSRG